MELDLFRPEKGQVILIELILLRNEFIIIAESENPISRGKSKCKSRAIFSIWLTRVGVPESLGKLKFPLRSFLSYLS